jgi:hypothetical protein
MNRYMHDDGFGPIVPNRFLGCMIGSSSSKSAPVVNQPGLNMLNANVGRATQVANLPFQSFDGEMTAPLSANEQMASSVAPGAFYAGAPALNKAQSTATGLTDYKPAGDLLEGISKYKNPYDSDVINATLGDLERTRQMQRNSDDQNTPMGAFGGSRHGVADSLTNEAFQRTAATTTANLRQHGFDTAAGLAGQDRAADMQGAGIRAGAAGLLGDLGQAQHSSFLSGLDSLITTGSNERNVRQSGNDAAFAEFMRRINYPIQGQQIINQSLGLVPASLGTAGKSSSFNFSLPMPG